MEIQVTDEGVVVICEKCNKHGPTRERWQESAKTAVLDQGWNGYWEHLAPNDHVYHLFCPTCKKEFDCDERD